MLSIGKLGQGQEAYYVETVAEGAEEYYLGHGEAAGRWMGRSAARLDLDGAVNGYDLAALLGHNDPAIASEDAWSLEMSDAEDAISREHTMWLARHGH